MAPTRGQKAAKAYEHSRAIPAIENHGRARVRPKRGLSQDELNSLDAGGEPPSSLKIGMRLQAKAEGAYYPAEIIALSQTERRAKAPIRVHFVGYGPEWDAWSSWKDLRSEVTPAETLKDDHHGGTSRPPPRGEKFPRSRAACRLESYTGKERKMAPTLGQKAAKTYDYSSLKVGMRLRAKTEGAYYPAEIIAVSQTRRAKAPIKVHFAGYGPECDAWLSGKDLRSKAIRAETLKDDHRGGTSRPPPRGEKAPRSRTACLLNSYTCKEGKEQDFAKLLSELTEGLKDTTGCSFCYYAFVDPRNFILAQFFKTQKLLTAYEEGAKRDLLERSRDLLDGPPTEGRAGTLLRSARNREVSLGENSFLSTWSYTSRPGCESAFADELIGTFMDLREDVPGIAWTGLWMSGPCTGLFVCAWESQERLEAYRGGLHKKHLESIEALHSPATTSHEGMVELDLTGPLQVITAEKQDPRAQRMLVHPGKGLDGCTAWAYRFTIEIDVDVRTLDSLVDDFRARLEADRQKTKGFRKIIRQVCRTAWTYELAIVWHSLAAGEVHRDLMREFEGKIAAMTTGEIYSEVRDHDEV